MEAENVVMSNSRSRSSSGSDEEPRKQLVFSGDLKGEIRLIMKITNRSRSRQSFKVKCTCNALFRIRPSVGVLDRAESAYITLTYRAVNGRIPESGRQHFGVYHIPAPDGCTAEGAWREHYGRPQGETRLKVFFRNASTV